jgi:diacylglycerol kinase family enzyme
MRALLVVNPFATTTSARAREVLVSALEGELKLDVVHTDHRGHAADLARQARHDGLDVVVALGGDGTVNEVVNGLLGNHLPVGRADDVPALAVVPGGGTNVFARALGIPRDPVEATGAVLAALRAHRRRSIGLGLAGERWFTFNAGMGWDAEVVARVDRARTERGTSRRTTTNDYVHAALAEFFLATDRRHPALTAYRPGAEPISGIHLAILANTAPWTFLGDRPLLTSPRASFDTGLDLYALTRLGTVSTLREVRRLMAGSSGTGDRKGVRREHDLGEVTLRAVRPVAAQVDGESLGETTALTFRAVPDALRVVV